MKLKKGILSCSCFILLFVFGAINTPAASNEKAVNTDNGDIVQYCDFSNERTKTESDNSSSEIMLYTDSYIENRKGTSVGEDLSFGELTDEISLYSDNMNVTAHFGFILAGTDWECAWLDVTSYFEYSDGNWVRFNGANVDKYNYAGYSLSDPYNVSLPTTSDSITYRFYVTVSNNGMNYVYCCWISCDIYGQIDYDMYQIN